jgi:hypothetical protein
MVKARLSLSSSGLAAMYDDDDDDVDDVDENFEEEDEDDITDRSSGLFIWSSSRP